MSRTERAHVRNVLGAYLSLLIGLSSREREVHIPDGPEGIAAGIIYVNEAIRIMGPDSPDASAAANGHVAHSCSVGGNQ